MRFVSWNLNGFAVDEQAALLRDTAWDVCAVQEVTTIEAFDALLATVKATGVCARSLIASTDRQFKYVAGLLARPPWALRDAAVLPAPSPERALQGTAGTAELSVSVASMALPPASSPAWGSALKVEQASVIARWLATLHGPAVIGIDANTPRVDHPDHARRSSGTRARRRCSASGGSIRCGTCTAHSWSATRAVSRPWWRRALTGRWRFPSAAATEHEPRIAATTSFWPRRR